MTNGTPFPYEPRPEGDQQARTGDGARRPARRSRARSLAALGVAAWVVLEIWLLTLVAGAAGGLTVLALLVAGFVLGSYVIKRAGRRAWRQLQETMQAAQPGATAPPPAPEGRTGGNALAMLGGLLLMVPGLVSDAAGLLCLFPPTAALLRRGTERALSRGEIGEALRQARSAEEQVRMHRPDGKVVQGEVIRDDDAGGAPPRD
ncbi:FxsA family protein [Streptomyces armeniacus]|uniref:FxsA family protein n=1 Tax=Streptomyces armeniacus TaxID=83291 RepID=A0A345XNV0_9ACTN|nr:FxsA family membrane protein [Streptomyces armeniacus]AXK33316.1 FxsA family protein [Streptomyces armeniacus]